MSKFFNAKSKKGFSLAYALVVCLFLVLITGGITTVAIMQHNETGADLNTRQAYITAKSGLSSMETAFRTDLIPSGQHPTELGWDVAYYVLYQETEGGPVLCSEAFKTVEEVEQFFKDHPDYIIVGGKGTYYKVTRDLRITSTGNEDHFTLTALNTTGKYNANVTENKGDLSIEVSFATTNIYSGQRIGVGPAAGRFLLCGQQVSLNENSITNGSNSALLAQYHKASSGGSGVGADGTDIICISTNESKFENTRTYFPIVFDRTFKRTVEGDRAVCATYNNGIYFLGSSNNSEVRTRINGTDVGAVSYFTNNNAYNTTLKCAYLCIKNTFIASAEGQTKLEYYGSEPVPSIGGIEYVPVRIINPLEIIRADGDNNIVSRFTVQPGCYAVKSGADMTDPGNWKGDIPEGWFEAAVNKNGSSIDLYDTINSLLDNNGEIHSGTNETENEAGIDNCIKITDGNGQFNTGDSKTIGYSATEDVSMYFNRTDIQNRDKMNIYLSPKYSPGTAGYYHLFAGRSMNFQWMGVSDFNVKDGVNVNFCSPNIMLTIGCEGSMLGCPNYNGTATHNKIVRTGDGQTGTFKLYGYKGNDSYTLTVFSDFTVEYTKDGETQSYTIGAGAYSSSVLEDGLDLFSDEAKRIFETVSPDSSPKVKEETSSENSITIDADYIKGVSTLVIPSNIQHIYYKNSYTNNFGKEVGNKLILPKGLKIRIGSKDGEIKAEFDADTYQWEFKNTNEKTKGVDLLDDARVAEATKLGETIDVDKEMKAPVTGGPKKVPITVASDNDPSVTGIESVSEDGGKFSVTINKKFLEGVSVLVVPDEVEHVYYKNPGKCVKDSTEDSTEDSTTVFCGTVFCGCGCDAVAVCDCNCTARPTSRPVCDCNCNCNKLVLTERLEIKKGSESSPPYIALLLGVYDFPFVGSEKENGFDLIDKDKLNARLEDSLANYKHHNSDIDAKFIDGEYS